MTWVLFAATAVVALASLAVAIMSTRLTRSALRQAARERDLLINQVCALAGKPWVPPPADEVDRVAEIARERTLERYLDTPDVLPDDL